MTDRRVRRRLTSLLVAALLGVAGAPAVVAPAQAGIGCSFELGAAPLPGANGTVRWLVNGSIVNTGAVATTTWMALIRFPYAEGAVVRNYWNVKAGSNPSIWVPVSFNKVLLPGGSANFGFDVQMPSSEGSMPSSGACRIIV